MSRKKSLVAVTIVVTGLLGLAACAVPAPINPTAVPATGTTSPLTTSIDAPTAVVLPTALSAAVQEPIVEYLSEVSAADVPLSFPVVAATDAEGNLYVLQSSNRIHKFDREGNFVLKWGAPGSKEGVDFDWGGDIAIDSSGHVFVTDLKNSRIQKFDLDGNFISQWGKQGTGDGEFVGVMGIAVDSKGNVYITDTNRDPKGNVVLEGYIENVQVFDNDGKFLAKWGIPGDGLGKLNVPSDIEVDSADNLYVVNQYSKWINKFDRTGKSLGGWDKCGPDSQNIMDPVGLALDADDNIYIANLASRRICKVSADGEFLGAFRSSGYGEGHFMSIVDVTVATDGTLYAPDIYGNKVIKYRIK
jgi:hypothetical protein